MLKSLLLITLVLGVAFAGKVPAVSKESHLIIKNKASADVTDSVAEVADTGDWEDSLGLNGNGQGLKIASGEEVDLREELWYFASENYFTLTLYFSDNTSDKFSANLRSAVNGDPVDFELINGKHKFTATAGANGNSLVIVIEDPVKKIV